MANLEDINPRTHKTRNMSQLIYDWWRRLRILVNQVFLIAYVFVLHIAGVLRTFAEVFYADASVEVVDESGQTVSALLYEQADVRGIILKTVFFVVITYGFAAAMFYLPSGRVQRSSGGD